MPVPGPPEFYRPKRQVLSVVFLSILFAVALVLVYVARSYLAIGLIGVGLGVLIVPVVNLLHAKARVPKGPASVLVIFALLGVVSVVTIAVVNLISGQLDLLVQHAPLIYQGLEAKVSGALVRYPWIADQLGNFNVARAAQTTVSAVLQGLTMGVSALAWTLVVLIIALYVAANSRSYFRGILSVFPAYMRREAASVLGACATVLRRWFKGQLLIMGITGVLTTLGLWIIGVDYWLLFGAITVTLSFIPFLGSILATVIATLVTLGSSPDQALWVLLLFIIAQQLESNVTVPLVMKGAVELPEAHLLLLALIFMSWLGLVGAFIAAPVMAVARTALVMTYFKRMDQKVHPPNVSRIETGRESA